MERFRKLVVYMKDPTNYQEFCDIALLDEVEECGEKDDVERFSDSDSDYEYGMTEES